MVDLSHIARVFEEREAAMTEEERAERRRERKETERKLAERFERMVAPMRAVEDALAPLRGFQSVLDQVRMAEEGMASVRLGRTALDFQHLTLPKELATNPLADALRGLAGKPISEFARALQDNPLLESTRRLSKFMPETHIRFPELTGLDRLRDLTAGLGVFPASSRNETFLPPRTLLPLRPPRDVDQDERFESLTEVVVAQTGQIVELRREVREVRESATRDAHRERTRSIRSERVGARLQWWHVVVASFLSAVLGAVASRLIVGG